MAGWTRLTMYHVDFNQEGNIDVSLLHCGLNTEQQIIEEDAIWEWNKLFTEIVSVVAISNEKENSA